MKPGDVISLDRSEEEPLDVKANGILIARAEVVLVNERYGIRLLDIVSPATRLNKTVSTGPHHEVTPYIPPLFAILICALLLAGSVHAAPTLPLISVTDGDVTRDYTVNLQILLILTALTLLPTALLCMTSFTRFIIVLGDSAPGPGASADTA